MRLRKIDSFKYDDIAKLRCQLFGTSTRDKTLLPSHEVLLKAAQIVEPSVVNWWALGQYKTPHYYYDLPL